MSEAMQPDGLGAPTHEVPTSTTNGDSGHYVVALLDLRGRDRGGFHFMRLDRSGIWSQKMSTGPVTQRDNQRPKRRLTDLCAARFNVAYTFVGFFVVNEDVQGLLQQRGV